MWLRGLSVFALLAGALTLTVSGARAATITVNTLADENDGSCADGDCSLRDAVRAAAAGDTVDFDVTGTITLTQGLIMVTKTLAIDGPGAASLAVSGNGASTIWLVVPPAGARVDISGLSFVKSNGSALAVNGRVNVADCAFTDNAADSGAAISNAAGGLLTMSRCVFANNRASGSGGAIVTRGALTVTDSALTGNSARNYGGGIYVTGNTSATLLVAGGVFSGNTAYDGGGIQEWNSRASLTVTGATFISNTAARNGGALYAYSGAATVIDTVFTGNTAGTHGGAILKSFNMLTVTRGVFADNLAAAGMGGGVANWATASVADSIFISNTSRSGDGGGGIASYGTVAVSRSLFSGNRALRNDGGGGGILNQAGGTLHVAGCVFAGNQVQSGSGGGIASAGHLDAVNSAFIRNTAQWGGGVYNRAALAVVNSTFLSNTAISHGGGVYNNEVTPTLKNVILWGDGAPNGPELYNNNCSALIAYSDIQGSGGSTAWNPAVGSDGGGNIDAAPLFEDPAGGVRLRLNSPGIDAGDNAAVPAGVAIDLGGSPRFVDVPGVPDTGHGAPPIVDMGACEARHAVYLPYGGSP
jgi:CSLREA domain-containing protein